MKNIKAAAYVAFSLGVALACYLRPAPDDFDRYVYEALLRSADQPIGEIYRVVKHESPRAEASTVMDSPEHLAQLGPLYAIRPLYLQVTGVVIRAGLSPKRAIDLISAGALFIIAMVVWGATGNGFYSAFLMATPTVMMVGRFGGPDALSSLVVVAGCVAVWREKLFAGILLLMISIWIRTDNLLLVLILLAWLAWGRKLGPFQAGALALLAVGSIEWINILSGNYGWRVLLHYSFIGGKYPGEIASGITLGQYARIFVENAEALAPQLAPWLLLAIAAWRLKPSERWFLAPVGIACAARYLLFPSGEARYFNWAFLVTGIVFIRGVLNAGDRAQTWLGTTDVRVTAKAAA